MRVCILGSGSDGNCTYLQLGKYNILIDLGFSLKKIKSSLEKINVNINDIDYVFITHEHIDHVKSLGSFLRTCKAKVYIHKKSFDVIRDKIGRYDDEKIIYIDKKDIYIDNVYISNFDLTHDSVHCLGYSFYENNKKFVYITDTGYISKIVEYQCQDADILAIESNYDLDMLMLGAYPWNLKNRIKGKFGHLSNDDCLNLLKKMDLKKLKKVFLMHLSKENNTKEKAIENIKGNLPKLNVEISCEELSSLIEI